MATTDLDPVFVKALRLLHSKREDAADQLKQMLDDVISQRKGLKSSSDSKDSKSSKKHSEEDKVKRREAEKRSLEKSKGDVLDEDLPVIKKVKKESPRPASSPSRSDEGRQKTDGKHENVEKSRKDKEDRERSRKDGEKKIKHDKEKEREKEKERSKAKEEVKKDESDDDMNAEDFAFGLGIACVVCNQFDVKSGNQLVECQECHHLYHQECHKPPVTEYDVHDPRFVWYCHRCTKNLKKIASGGKGGKSKSSGSEEVRDKPRSQPPSSTGNITSSAGNVNVSKQPKGDNSSGPLFSFRRSDGKATTGREPSSTNTPGAKPMSGLASLAANLSGKTEQTKVTKPDNGSKPSRSDPLRSSFGKAEQSDKVSLLNQSQRKPEGPKPVVKTSDQSKPSVKPTSGSIKQTQGGASSVVNAEKRVQMMKKKAAIKIQEKRASLK
ncbi:hypothetical protein FSP39_009589 [Pinctada imbricata]|uniref:Integrator complex subunit 12 n=1 Tax=Pinctada imbricata TaxID=66713 RepID=A0AA88YNB9_PINIB|nr:hypothetical protein FSP39_009589 [Pinctada imbricata]